MVNLIAAEFTKLKRSRMALITVLGAMVTPFVLLVSIIKEMAGDNSQSFTFQQIFSQNSMYLLMLFGLMVYAVFAAYLFSREYSEDTLKTILTIPVSKNALLAAKFVVLFCWCMFLSLLCWVFCLLVGLATGSTGLSLNLVVNSLAEVVIGTTLLAGLMTPIVFVAIWTKGLVVPIVCGAALVMFNAALSSEEWGALFPWSASYLLATKSVEKTGFSPVLSLTIVLATMIIGGILCVWRFSKKDIK